MKAVAMPKHLKRFVAFVKERHAVYCARESGYPKPWTRDNILRHYRFTNVYRELDKVTIWIRENWRDPHRVDPDLWFAMAVARKINWPSTLKEIGYPVPWKPDRFIKTMADRQERGEQLENSAYMITAGIGKEWIGVPKYIFLAKVVFQTLWEKRIYIRPTKEDTLESFHKRLMVAPTVKSFIAGQIVADVKFAEPLRSAPDFMSWAASGPGSQRGLNRLLGFPVNQRWKELDWALRLAELRATVDPLIKEAEMPRISAQDLQNCLCEYDKYERVRLGEGRPKQLYNGG